jgi:sugar phosphate isomerase/epimerase
MIGISFMTANFCARPTGWNMTGGWGQGDTATNAHFAPLATFGARLDEYLTEVRAMGFTAVDLWTSILNPAWATDAHIAVARDRLQEYRLPVYSIGGWLGSTPGEFARTCAIATALGAPVLGGDTSMLRKDRAFVVATLKETGLRLGIENHPEKSVGELLEKIGDGGEGTIGATVDTGWFGTQGVDAAEALRELAPQLLLVHLKDVRAVGAHDTCRYGAGVVPIERCVRVLQEIGYGGTNAVDHEPELFDPTEDLKASLALLKGWLGQ